MIEEPTLQRALQRALKTGGEFAVSASDHRGLVAAGRVTRVIVDVDRFLEKAAT